MTTAAVQVDLAPTETILGRYPHESRHLISVLQDVQLAYRYLPREALEQVAGALDVPLAKVYSVATFYKAFSLQPKGEKVLRVCTGTACHIRGAPLILSELETRLGIKPGQTTDDLQFSLEAVNCVGACALAPVVLVNEQAHGNLSVTRVRRLVRTPKKAAAAKAPTLARAAGDGNGPSDDRRAGACPPPTADPGEGNTATPAAQSKEQA